MGDVIQFPKRNIVNEQSPAEDEQQSDPTIARMVASLDERLDTMKNFLKAMDDG